MKPIQVVALTTLLITCAASATEISDKYAQLGGANSFLGTALDPEKPTPDGVGKFRHYQNGSIYFHPQTGAHEVHGLIRQRWAQLGWELSAYGYPMTDEINLVDGSGKVTKFQGGEMIWRSATNQVSEVKATDLVVDLPFVVGEPWAIIQANAVLNGDSHSNQFAYCWDMGHAKLASQGRAFVASATAPVVYVEEGFNGPDNAGNVVIQRFGEGRYGSYLHIGKGSYSKKTFSGSGINFLPQTIGWSGRPKPATGTVLAEIGDTGAKAGAFHMHFCVTTTPDRAAFGPFESVPVAFRNYSVSKNNGQSWTYVPVGVPRRGEWIRREQAKVGQMAAAQVNAATTVISYGTVKGSIAVNAASGKPKGAGTFTVTVLSAWGEPLKQTMVSVAANALNGPWPFTIANVPAFNGSKVAVTYTGPWTTDFDSLGGESTAFNVPPNGTATAPTATMKTVLIH